MAQQPEEKKSDDFPVWKSPNSIAAKVLTPAMWNKYKNHKTKTAGFSLVQCIGCPIQTENNHLGVYAGDVDCYTDFADFFGPCISQRHNGFNGKHVSNLNVKDIKGNINKNAPVISTRIRVGRNIAGFGLSPGITKQQRLEVEALMINCFKSLKGDLEGTYYPLQGMKEDVRKQLVADHFLFISGDPYLKIGGMERDWPEGRGIFHNKSKTFLVWIGEEDQLRIIAMEKGGNVPQVFDRLVRGLNAIESFLNTQKKKFIFHEKYGYIHTCPSNLGTGLRASVHIDLGALKKKLGSLDELKKIAKAMNLQVRGSKGETTKDESTVYDISNLHRLGYTEVQLVQTMIDGVNNLSQQNNDASKK